jgi:membrane protease YdiL (CAAX protease family)
MIHVSNKRRFFEIAAAVFTGVGKIVFMDILNWRLPFITTAILAWSVYVIHQHKTNPGILSRWGFRLDNFKKVTRNILPFGLFALAFFVIIGFYRNTINVTWHIFPILILYPIWGIIQQFLVIGLVAGNLNDMEGKKLNKRVTIVVTALLFGLIHYPYCWLMIGTFILAILYGYIYLKDRNVFVMGLFHGWLGGLFFYTVVGRDPFVEVFSRILK